MIFVIVPLGKAASAVINWLVRVLVYVIASTVGGALMGLGMGLIGSLIYRHPAGADGGLADAGDRGIRAALCAA